MVKEEIVKKERPEEVKAVISKQKLIIYINALTTFLVVIFLQIMMFVQNAVPLTNGILMSVGSSITYFILSILTLLVLFACHEFASYMILKWTPFFVLFYGFLVMLLGILVMAIEGAGAEQAAQKMWGSMSLNQREFFDNKLITLQDTRYTNTLWAGMFGIVIGVLILIEGLFFLILRNAKAAIDKNEIEWNPSKLSSRNINKIRGNEKCEFMHINNYHDK